MSSFKLAKQAVQQDFARIVEQGFPVFRVDVDLDRIWEVYLDSFPADLKQEHTCSCCRSFIRQAGGLVAIDASMNIVTLWDNTDMLLDPQHELIDAFENLAEYVKSLPIVGDFKAGSSRERFVGTEKSPDPKLGVVWEHFYLSLPQSMTDTPRHAMKETAQVFERGLNEITDHALQTVLELIDQGSLYRGNEFQRPVETFKATKHAYFNLPDKHRKNYVWYQSSRKDLEPILRIRNTAIGQLLQDLSEGKGVEEAVTSFERITAPTNYKRPKALVTPRMVEDAKKTLNEMGLISALKRRRLDTRDLSAADALFTYRPVSKQTDVFDDVIAETAVDVNKLTRVEEIPAAKFFADVLPNVRGLRVLLEPRHLPNLVTLTGPEEDDVKPLFKWDNSYGWSYTGGVADSIKERVKSAGGKVDGWGRFSLSWFNHDDLDIHFAQTNGRDHTYFRQKRTPLAKLDVDMNTHSLTRDPVENIYFENQLPAGEYGIWVQNFQKRESQDAGWEIEAEINGVIYHFSSPISPQTGQDSENIVFSVDNAGNVTFKDNGFAKVTKRSTKWGLKTGIWHQVNAITTSPNHWERPVGNKHLFFLINGCTSDEVTRPFYNEFLVAELSANRKVCEVLAGKIEVTPAVGAELSGLGFSETIRNDVYVEVDGAFKRTLKVKF